MGAGSNLTLLEWAKRIAPDGSFYKIAEVLNKLNAIVQILPFKEANQVLSHIMSVRNSLPTGEFVGFYGAAAPETSDTKQITEQLSMLRGLSEVDATEAELSGNVQAFRDTENVAFIEGLMQTFVKTIFYGNQATDPLSFNGLATRLGRIAAAGTVVSGKAVTAEGSTANKQTSVYIVQPGDEKFFGLFPRGMVSNMVKHNDRGRILLPVMENNVQKYRDVYVSQFEINGGIGIKDARCVMRVANIEVGTPGWRTEANIKKTLNAITAALRVMPNAGKDAQILANNDFMAMLDTYVENKTTAGTTLSLTRGEVGNYQVGSISGFPIKLCESIVSNEAVVPA